MSEMILHSANQQDFLACIGEERASIWPWAPGIELVYRKESIGWGVALNIQRKAQRPNLFSDTLKRRFEDVESYDGYYLCLDSQQTFVVWHAVSNECFSVVLMQGLINGLLELVGLTHLSAGNPSSTSSSVEPFAVIRPLRMRYSLAQSIRGNDDGEYQT